MISIACRFKKLGELLESFDEVLDWVLCSARCPYRDAVFLSWREYVYKLYMIAFDYVMPYITKLFLFIVIKNPKLGVVEPPVDVYDDFIH
jgi:hypothetical protein